MLPEVLSFCESHCFEILRFDIVTIGNGLQPLGNGGCKVGNVYNCHYLAVLLFLTGYPDTGVADGFTIFTALGQWSERFY